MKLTNATKTRLAERLWTNCSIAYMTRAKELNLVAYGEKDITLLSEAHVLLWNCLDQYEDTEIDLEDTFIKFFKNKVEGVLAKAKVINSN